MLFLSFFEFPTTFVPKNIKLQKFKTNKIVMFLKLISFLSENGKHLMKIFLQNTNEQGGIFVKYDESRNLIRIRQKRCCK